ncbi:MAG: hypothetical protein JWR13_4 [Mycobacterium sp.]|nr:hypothetical protein [Mycobacterium sp.]
MSPHAMTEVDDDMGRAAQSRQRARRAAWRARL